MPATQKAIQDCVALVTGGMGVIGQAVCEALRAQGATVIAAGVHADARAMLPLARGAATIRRLDVARAEEVRALVTEIEQGLGALDILVNVAGVVSRGDAQSLAEAEWDRVMAVNLKGSFLCCQAVMAGMRARGYGRIVNIGSVVGKNGGNARPWLDRTEQQGAANVAYGISKAGVHAMTVFLARELAAHGVTVNAVAPGPVGSPMTQGFPAQLQALVPLGRMSTPEEVARAVVFLASPGSAAITGEILDVNGGLWCD